VHDREKSQAKRGIGKSQKKGRREKENFGGTACRLCTACPHKGGRGGRGWQTDNADRLSSTNLNRNQKNRHPFGKKLGGVRGHKKARENKTNGRRKKEKKRGVFENPTKLVTIQGGL